METTVKIGKMPGQVQEYAVLPGTSVKEAISLAGLDAEGYEVKVDGQTVNPEEASVEDTTNLILLTQQVKGN